MVDFSAIDARLEWASTQLGDLEGRHVDFRVAKPHEILIDEDPKSPEHPGHSHLYLKINEPAATDVITEVALRAGDVVHSLRAALDYLACAVVPHTTKNTAFPIWRNPVIPTKPQWKGCVLGKVKGASPDVIKLFLGLQPYFGGNHEQLCVVDYLDIIDKHRLLITAFAAFRSVQINVGANMRETFVGKSGDWAKGIPDLWVSLVPAERYPLHDGYVLFSAPLEEIRKLQAQPTIEIALGEPNPLEGRSVMGALTDLAKFVQDIINQFRRIL